MVEKEQKNKHRAHSEKGRDTTKPKARRMRCSDRWIAYFITHRTRCVSRIIYRTTTAGGACDVFAEAEGEAYGGLCNEAEGEVHPG